MKITAKLEIPKAKHLQKITKPDCTLRGTRQMGETMGASTEDLTENEQNWEINTVVRVIS